MLVRRFVVAFVSVVWLAAAQPSTPLPDPDAALRAARLHSKALFEGADDLDTPTVEEYRAHLAGMCKGVVDTVTAYPGLSRAIPDIAADQPRTPALAIGNDFSRLFGQEAVPSEQAYKEDNYYAKLTLKQDPHDPQGRNYQQRLEAAILAYDGKLYPSGVLVMALDATHGNYPLAVLTAHNLLKEYTETGRAQEADGPSPPNGRQGAQAVGMEPRFGEFTSHLAALRLSTNKDKMGPWYHFFAPLAVEAWGSRFSASSYEAIEHGGRHVSPVLNLFFGKGAFSKDDPEKQRIDECALQAAYDVNQALGDRQDPPAQPEDPIQPTVHTEPAPTAPTGWIQVDVVDNITGYVSFAGGTITLKRETGPGNWSSGYLPNALKTEVPAGTYLVRAEGDNYDPETANSSVEQSGVEVRPAQLTHLVLRLPSSNGRLVVTVRDEKGVALPDVDVAISGSESLGPWPSPATFTVLPGNYRVIIPQSVVKGKYYRGKEETATVRANHTEEISVLLEPYPPSPQAASIAINPGWLTLNVHDDYELGATVYDGDGLEMPSAAVTWSSTAPAVATVDASGKVTGRGSGQAQVVARSGTATSSITVTVNSGARLSTCTIADHRRMLPGGGAGFDFHVVAKDTDGKPVANVTFRWSGSNDVVALVNSKTGSITTETPGELTIYAHGVGPDGSEAECDTTIMVDYSYQDVLASGKVMRPDGSAVSGATVRAWGGSAIQSDAEGNFTILLNQGPYPEDTTVIVEATLGSASGEVSGRVKKGVVKGQTRGVAQDLRITLRPAQAAGGSGSNNSSKRTFHFHLLRYWLPARPQEVDFGLVTTPHKDDKGLFTFPWTVTSYAGEDLGVFTDEDSLCAVLRGYGETVVYTNDSILREAVRCTKEGPVVKPNPPGAGAPAGGVAGSGPGSGMETLAAVMLLSGVVTYSDLAAPAGRPLRPQDTVAPGGTLDVHKDAHVTFQAPNGAVVSVNGDSHVTLMTGNKAKISRGSLEVRTRNENEPSFAGVNRTPDREFRTETPDATLDPLGTWYKVSVSERGTGVDLLEGSARLVGTSLWRTDAGFNILEGKRAAAQSLDLKVGDHAFAFRVPSWTSGGALPAGAPSSPLDQPDPWNNPQVQQLIDEWLRTATPEKAAHDPGPWRYSDWGVLIGPGTTIAGPPDHPAGWSRYQTLWAIRVKLPSINLCTLGEFVERRMAGKGLDACAQAGSTRAGLPSWMAAPSQAPRGTQAPPPPDARPQTSTPRADPLALARAQVAREQEPREKPVVPHPAPPAPVTVAPPTPVTHSPQLPAPPPPSPLPPSPPPPPPPPPRVGPADIHGVWYCNFQETATHAGSKLHFHKRDNETFTVRPGNLVELDEHGRTLAPSYVRGNAIGYRLTLPMDDVNLTFTYDLELNGDALAGTEKIEGSDGSFLTEKVSCSGRHETKR